MKFFVFFSMGKILPVRPSFLLQVSHEQRLRFFFSELVGEASRKNTSNLFNETEST
jgi:hypothetical protein